MDLGLGVEQNPLIGAAQVSECTGGQQEERSSDIGHVELSLPNFIQMISWKGRSPGLHTCFL